jgi:hypothetical protein
VVYVSGKEYRIAFVEAEYAYGGRLEKKYARRSLTQQSVRAFASLVV